MYRAITDHLQWRADLLLAGDLQELSRHYALPQAVFLQDELAVITSPEGMVDLLGHLRAALMLREVQRTVVTVKALEIPRKDRFRVWVRWGEQTADPAQDCTSEGICYLRKTAQGYQSEMLHITRMSMPEFRHFQPLRVRSA